MFFKTVAFLVMLLITTSSFAVTIDDELHAAAQHIQSIPVEDRSYTKYLTFYAVPEKDREKAILAVSFLIHSLVGPTPDGITGNTGVFTPLATMVHTADVPVKQPGDSDDKVPVPINRKFVSFKHVPGSNTLYWIDLRDYNWTEEAFEKVASLDPYIRKPWVSQDYDILRHETGNALLRADWFLVHCSNTTKQIDRKLEPLYYELLYALVDIPKNADEYRAYWGITDELRAANRVVAAVVDKGESYVSRHARELSGVRTELGYHWESADYITMDGENDVVENFGIQRNEKGQVIRDRISRKADAHEYITSNYLGLQVYFLADGNENRLETADPGIVWHQRDRSNDIRVRMADSCIVCHAVGINPTKDFFREVLGNKELELVNSNKDYQLLVQRIYTSDKLPKESDDQLLYARAVLKTNGLQPIENAANYQDMMDWYERDVTLEQAAIECGVTVEEFIEKVGEGVGIRLGVLSNPKNPRPIPREVWEDKGFETAMLLIHRQEAIVLERQVQIIVEECPVVMGKDEVAKIHMDDTFKIIAELENQYGLWYKIDVNGTLGWVHQSKVKVIE